MIYATAVGTVVVFYTVSFEILWVMLLHVCSSFVAFSTFMFAKNLYQVPLLFIRTLNGSLFLLDLAVIVYFIFFGFRSSKAAEEIVTYILVPLHVCGTCVGSFKRVIRVHNKAFKEMQEVREVSTLYNVPLLCVMLLSAYIQLRNRWHLFFPWAISFLFIAPNVTRYATLIVNTPKQTQQANAPWGTIAWNLSMTVVFVVCALFEHPWMPYSYDEIWEVTLVNGVALLSPVVQLIK